MYSFRLIAAAAAVQAAAFAGIHDATFHST